MKYSQSCPMFNSHVLINATFSTSLILQLFEYKLNNRLTKLILDIKDVDSVKNVIKTFTNLGCDGIYFDTMHTSDSFDRIEQILTVASRMPYPYDARWYFYISFASFESGLVFFRRLKYKKIEDMITAVVVHTDEVKQYTDFGFNPCKIIVKQREEDIAVVCGNIKTNKLGGVYIAENIRSNIVAKKELCHSLEQSENHIDYPSSSLLKRYMFDRIIDMYGESV